MLYRYITWVAIGVAAAFLIVATAAFSDVATEWLAFSVSIGTLVASTSLAYRYRRHTATVVCALLVAVVSGWTIVASLVFDVTTVQSLALASALAISALAIVGASAHELSSERALAYAAERETDHESGLRAAA